MSVSFDRFALADYEEAVAFWRDEGWTERVELVTLSRFVPGE